MNKRGTGVSFCFIGAFLFSVKHIVNAINFSYDTDYLIMATIASLAIGISYIWQAEKEE